MFKIKFKRKVAIKNGYFYFNIPKQLTEFLNLKMNSQLEIIPAEGKKHGKHFIIKKVENNDRRL